MGDKIHEQVELEQALRKSITTSERVGKNYTSLLETLKRIEEEKKAPTK